MDEKFEASQSPSSDGSDHQHTNLATGDYLGSEMHQNNTSATSGANQGSRDVTDAAHAQKNESGNSPHEGATAPQVDLHMNVSMGAPPRTSGTSPPSEARDASYASHLSGSQRLYPDQRGSSPGGSHGGREAESSNSYANLGQQQHPYPSPMTSYGVDRFCAGNGYSSPHAGFNLASTYPSESTPGAFKQTPPPPPSSTLASDLYSNSLHRNYMTQSPFIPRHYPPLPPHDTSAPHSGAGEAGTTSSSGYNSTGSALDQHGAPTSVPSVVKPEYWLNLFNIAASQRATALAIASGFAPQILPHPALWTYTTRTMRQKCTTRRHRRHHFHQ